MNGLRFKVGELAIFAIATKANGIPYVGCNIEIMYIGPFHAGQQWNGIAIPNDCDYLLLAKDGRKGAAFDWQLRKLDPPAEPESITRREEVQA